jgi:putative tricarboxylic transport membrane protein
MKNNPASPPTAVVNLGKAEDAAERALGFEPGTRLRSTSGDGLWLGNVIGSSAAVLIGIYVVISGFGFGFGTAAKPGAGVFPVAIGFILAALGALWLVQCLIGRVQREESPADADRSGRLRIVLSIAVIVGFALFVNVLGYQITMLLVMGTLLTFIAKRKWWLTLILSAVMAFGTFALFDYGLGVVLPVSSIPFLEQLGL